MYKLLKSPSILTLKSASTRYILVHQHFVVTSLTCYQESKQQIEGSPGSSFMTSPEALETVKALTSAL